jgi:hypothetical protein
MSFTYEVIQEEFASVIKRTDENGFVAWIPVDEANSDYQAYLNKDKAEQSTPSV